MENSVSNKPSFKPYTAPAGGWGSAKSLGHILRQEGVLASGALTLSRQNKVDGFQCVSCAWPKPAQPVAVRVLREWCEGDRLGDHRAHRCTPEFFAAAHGDGHCWIGTIIIWNRPAA